MAGRRLHAESEALHLVRTQFNEALLQRLRPEIIAHNRDPITVSINSGSSDYLAVMDGILRLLRRTAGDNPHVSKIITVATQK